MVKQLNIRTTPIPGLLVVDLPVHGDARGWFKENWQREKMIATGLPDFGPVQNNISYNQAVGVTRGIHAEPWDKYISVAEGRVFGAWVDLREGNSFGAVHWEEITPEVAIYVPSGVGNSFQTIDAPAVYTYLVNDHWSEQAQSSYTFLNLADETVAIPWPIPLEQAELSAKDLVHPRLAEVTPMRTGTDRAGAPSAPSVSSVSSTSSAADSALSGSRAERILVPGANGQLGRALQQLWAHRDDVDFVSRDQLDIGSPASIDAFDFAPYAAIVNAAAYTAVDQAETAEGRVQAWAVNAQGVAGLARAASRHGAALVHVSTDYVFDGSAAEHTEEEPLSPLGVYGQSKAAGDLAAASVPRHYILRTSWVVGDGANFVRTMASLAERGIDPAVVDDQVGRLSFTADIAGAIDHLLAQNAEPGVYNISSAGEPMSWHRVAREVFAAAGADPERVSATSTAEFFAGKDDVAARPAQSAFRLDKVRAAGFEPRDQLDQLRDYVRSLTRA